MSEWELSKENIQPLNTGRKTEILQQSLAEEPPDYYTQKRHFYEQQLRIYEGDDPLRIWCDYIVWVEQTFPKGGKDGNLSRIIQQCLLNLKDEEKYQNDDRFIDIWLKFAKMSIKPTEVYINMHSRNIGCQAARFFSAWAWEVEQMGNLKKADEVITDGINRNAQPIELLKFEQKQLEMRMMRQLTNGSEILQEQDHRSAFTVLKPNDNNKAPISRTGGSILPSNKENLIVGFRQPQPRNVSNNLNSNKFKISSASDNSTSVNGCGSAHVLNKENTKENDRLPGKWSKAKAPLSTALSKPKMPEFVVHTDPIQLTDSSRKQLPHSDRVLMSRKASHEPPVALFEPPNPMVRPMYDKMKVYGGGEEYSFEEIHAAQWWKKYEKERKRQEEEMEKQTIKAQLLFLQQKMQDLECRALCSAKGPCCQDPMTACTPKNQKIIKPSVQNSSVKKPLGDASRPGLVVGGPLPEHCGSSESLADSSDQPDVPNKLPGDGSLPTSAFDFYHDPTDVVQPPQCPVMPFAIYQDDAGNLPIQDENCPPPGFVQLQENREITGILLPSKDIAILPLDQHDDEEINDNEDSDDEVLAEPLLVNDDHTMLPPANTELFALATHFTSTPFVRQPSKVPIRAADDEPPLTEKVMDCQSAVVQRSWGLSTIIETSREGSSKSSSSNSANSVCQAKSFFSADKSVLTKNDTNMSTTYCTDINPFDIAFTNNCLNALSEPVFSRKNFCFHRSPCSAIKAGVTLMLKDTSYAISRQFADGSYAKVFLATTLSNELNMDKTLSNTEVAIKVCKNANEWEFYISDELYNRLISGKYVPSVLESIVKFHSIISLDNGIALVSDFCSYGSLLRVINAYKSVGNTMPEILVLYFTLEILLIVSNIHKCGIIHADVKPDNFVLNKLPGDNAINEISSKTTCLQIIDFGRAIDLTIFKPGITFNTVVSTDDFKCIEMMENRPWVYQTDWYGVLGTIHVMLFGEYMKVQKNSSGTWEPTIKFKRWQSDLWKDLFTSLLNIPSSYNVPNIEPFVVSIMEKLEEQKKRFLWEARRMSTVVSVMH